MFREAGDTISRTFGIFLQELGIGLEKLKDVSISTILLLSTGIGPVMGAVKDFTDAILSVLSSKIPDEYDKEGKPIKWRKFDAVEFANAAELITDAFLVFLEKFSSKSKNISLRSAMIINMFKEGIEPVMNAVATWTNTIMDFVTGREIEVTDVKTGQNIKQRFHIDPKEFQAHGETVADSFIGFIEGLWNKFNAQGYTEKVIDGYEEKSYALGLYSSKTPKYKNVHGNHVCDLINGLSDINSIMEAVVSYVDVIIKVADWIKNQGGDLKKTGTLIGDVFMNFITALTSKFGTNEVYTNMVKQAIEGLGKAKTLITTFDGAFKALTDVVKKYDGKIRKEQIDGLYEILTYFVKDGNLRLIATLGSYDLKDTVKFMEKMADISKELEHIGKNMKDLEHIKSSCNFIVECMTIFKTNLDVLTGFTPREVSGLVAFLDKVADSSKLLNKMKDLGENPEQVSSAVDVFVAQIVKMNTIAKPDIHEVAPLPRYMHYVNQAANGMLELAEIMNSADITEAITKFLSDIELLTKAELRERTTTSRKLLLDFGKDLQTFSRDVLATQRKVVTFTTKMKSATDALRKFDKAVADNEKRRNESLEKFGELVKTIADNMQQLNTQINNLDENKVMNNFRGISTLFQMVLGRANDAQQQQQQNQQQQNQNQPLAANSRQQQNQNQRQQQQNQQTLQNMPRGRQVINVYFADTQLSGFAEVTTN